MVDANHCEALVIGGGLAGGAAATLLAKAGRRVTLLEKSTGPHDQVCGEFLSAEALHYLQLLGVNAAALGALPITTLHFTHGKRTTEAALPFPAMSLRRRLLDEALLACAAEAGATVCRGVSVDSLTPKGTGDEDWVASAADGQQFVASTAFLATGKRDLRGHARPVGAGWRQHGGLLAFKMYFRLQDAEREHLRSAIEVFLFPHGYCGLQPVEDGTANLSLLVERAHYRNWDHQLKSMCDDLPLLRRRLDGATCLLSRPLALSHIPYGFQRNATPDGLWALGDQAAVIPSFSGDGMSIALHSAVRATRMWLDGCSASTYQRALARELRRPITLATLVSRLLVGAPHVATTIRHVPGVMRQIALQTRVPRVM